MHAAACLLSVPYCHFSMHCSLLSVPYCHFSMHCSLLSVPYCHFSMHCSLLSVGVGRRRTATVRTQSFTTLFVLSRADLDKTLEDYPDTRMRLQAKAKSLLQQDKERKKESRMDERTGEEPCIVPSPQAAHTTNVSNEQSIWSGPAIVPLCSINEFMAH